MTISSSSGDDDRRYADSFLLFFYFVISFKLVVSCAKSSARDCRVKPKSVGKIEFLRKREDRPCRTLFAQKAILVCLSENRTKSCEHRSAAKAAIGVVLCFQDWRQRKNRLTEKCGKVEFWWIPKTRASGRVRSRFLLEATDDLSTLVFKRDTRGSRRRSSKRCWDASKGTSTPGTTSGTCGQGASRNSSSKD